MKHLLDELPDVQQLEEQQDALLDEPPDEQQEGQPEELLHDVPQEEPQQDVQQQNEQHSARDLQPLPGLQLLLSVQDQSLDPLLSTKVLLDP